MSKICRTALLSKQHLLRLLRGWLHAPQETGRNKPLLERINAFSPGPQHSGHIVASGSHTVFKWEIMSVSRHMLSLVLLGMCACFLLGTGCRFTMLKGPNARRNMTMKQRQTKGRMWHTTKAVPHCISACGCCISLQNVQMWRTPCWTPLAER